MTFEEWRCRDGGKFRFTCDGEWARELAGTKAVDEKLDVAVAKYLFVRSKDVPNDLAGLFRATALAILQAPVDAALLSQAAKWASNDDQLHALWADPELDEVWHYHHREEIERAEAEYDSRAAPRLKLRRPPRLS